MANTIYGYCRISTRQQNIDRQERNIKAAYPAAVILKEAFTGTKMTRPEWMKLAAKVQAGDTIVFDEVSRMARNAEEGFQTYKTLYEMGVNLVFLKEPHINTEVFAATAAASVPMTGTDVDVILTGINSYLMILAEKQIRIAFDAAQAEVDKLHQRTSEGMKTAALAGKQIGNIPGVKLTTKKSIEKKEVIRKHSKAFNGTLTDEECMQLTGLARNTFYKYKREMLAEAAAE